MIKLIRAAHEGASSSSTRPGSMPLQRRAGRRGALGLIAIRLGH
jgi:hypothetical protein